MVADATGPRGCFCHTSPVRGEVLEQAGIAVAIVSQDIAAWVHLMIESLTSSIMPRTTLDLDASVLAELRERAHAEHKSMGQVASERLAIALAQQPREGAPLSWPSRGLGKPKVDLADKEALRRALDAESGRSR